VRAAAITSGARIIERKRVYADATFFLLFAAYTAYYAALTV
jgi:hypothetical protein